MWMLIIYLCQQARERRSLDRQADASFTELRLRSRLRSGLRLFSLPKTM